MTTKLLPSLFKIFKPDFWNYTDAAIGLKKHMFNFRLMWKQAVFLTFSVAFIPLVAITIMNYNVTKKALESEWELRIGRLVSNTRRTISFFLDERRFALNFITKDNPYEDLSNPERLRKILANLKSELGGFADLGIIDSTGRQVAYVGPYNLEGINYTGEQWFTAVVERGVYVSDMFMGHRKTPHMVMAVKTMRNDNDYFIIRATLDIQRFTGLLSKLEIGEQGDAFIINEKGLIQMPSRHHGDVFSKIQLPVPEYSERSEVFQTSNPDGKAVYIGYAYITDTPYIFMVVKPLEEVAQNLNSVLINSVLYLALSGTIVLIVILWMVTFLTNNIYVADKRRLLLLHEVEYTNKMASIGRLAAGVAHEINNPLSIINEKAGLIKDMFTFKEQYKKDPKLIASINSIISSVERCGTITKRLLGFTRKMTSKIEDIDLEDLAHEVVGFIVREANYRDIKINVNVQEKIEGFKSDRGKLQQIFLNLLNNALAALEEGGNIDIQIAPKSHERVLLEFSDNGCGISETEIDRIFEPFFTTKSEKGGTGLGLSITYNLIHEIGGTITVKSELGQGTSFNIILPLKIKQEDNDENTTCG